jgi:hypothetical protein
MRGDRPIGILALLATWLIGQMTGVVGLFVMPHETHVASTSQWKDRVVLVFSHERTESDTEHSHDDHVVSCSAEESYLRRGPSESRLLLPLVPSLAYHFLPVPCILRDHAPASSLDADHAAPLLVLRTVVLTV